MVISMIILLSRRLSFDFIIAIWRRISTGSGGEMLPIVESMLALSIRQPYAELILRGIKTVEYRTLATRIIGERFHIYAPLKKARVDQKIWSRDLAMPNVDTRDALPQWLIELAAQVGMIEP